MSPTPPIWRAISTTRAAARSSLDKGLRTVDSSVGGLGGCPYAPGAKGNVATGRVVDFLDRAGHATGIDRAGLAAAEAFVAGLALGETNRG
jgi:hydroxymethylglutaryl-CoA lyase